MKLDYDKDMDLLYLYLETKVPNIAEPTDHDEILVFRAKRGNRVVGFEIENLQKNLELILENLGLTKIQKLALLVYLDRKLKGVSQSDYAKDLDVSLSTIKRVEQADANIGFQTIDSIIEKTDMDLSSIFQKDDLEIAILA